MNNDSKIVYIDQVDWMHEVGHAADGNMIYPSLESIQTYCSCAEHCGVIKAEISFIETVLPGSDDDEKEVESKRRELRYLLEKKSMLLSRLGGIEWRINKVKDELMEIDDD